MRSLAQTVLSGWILALIFICSTQAKEKPRNVLFLLGKFEFSRRTFGAKFEQSNFEYLQNKKRTLFVSKFKTLYSKFGIWNVSVWRNVAIVFEIWNLKNCNLNFWFLADDAGFEMRNYRNRVCQMQNLDNLAKNSLIFNNAYTSASSCSPRYAKVIFFLSISFDRFFIHTFQLRAHIDDDLLTVAPPY